MILTLSHGQAAVERGFSINNSLSIVNISEKSLVCKKLLKDHLLSNQQEVHTVPITNQLIRSVATARQKCKKSLEQERKRKRTTLPRKRRLLMKLLSLLKDVKNYKNFMKI